MEMTVVAAVGAIITFAVIALLLGHVRPGGATASTRVPSGSRTR